MRTLEATVGDGGTAGPPSALPPGTTIAQYRIETAVGIGASGIVYAARDYRLDRPVALKLLHDGRSDRLVREAQTLAKLQHPNVVIVYDVGEFRDQIYLAMELVDGQTLRQ